MAKYPKTLNLNMFFMEIQKLNKPKAPGQIIEIEISEYLDYLKLHNGPIESNDKNEVCGFKAVKLVAVVYRNKGKDDDLQWEMDLCL